MSFWFSLIAIETSLKENSNWILEKCRGVTKQCRIFITKVSNLPNSDTQGRALL